MNNSNIMLASSSPSSSAPAAIWTIAALVGAFAAVGLWTKQQQHQNNNGQNSKSKRRKSSSDADGSESISVEGSVMVTLPTWAIASLNDNSDNPNPSDTIFNRHYHTDNEMMSLAIHLSDRNITEGTGGPFGAAIFERHPPTTSDPDGYCTLVSIGMNRVVPLGNSTLHGEMLAIQLAQRKVGSFTLSLDVDGSDGSEHCASEGLFYDESREEEEGEEGGNENKNDENNDNIGGDASSKKKRFSTSVPEVCTPVSEKRKRQFELFTSCEPCCMCLGATLWSGVSRLVCGAKKSDAQAIGFDEGPVYEQSYKHLEEHGVVVTRNVLREEAAQVLRRYGSSGLIYNR